MPETKKFEFSTPMAVVVAGVVIAGAILYTNQHPAQSAGSVVQQPQGSVAIKAPEASDHRYGSAQAKIVLVEYSDFQCPFCSMIYPTLKSLVDESNGQIAWVMRNFPLTSIHPEATPAANAAECVAEQLGNDGFWRFADAIFNNQAKLGASYYPELAKSLGADATTFASCLATHKHQALIDAQMQDAINNGGQGTPYTVVVGGGKQIPFSGALPKEQIQSVINSVK